jgi:hypothetical protein
VLLQDRLDVLVKRYRRGGDSGRGKCGSGDQYEKLVVHRTPDEFSKTPFRITPLRWFLLGLQNKSWTS